MTSINRSVADYTSDNTALGLTLGVLSITERLRQVIARAPSDHDDPRVLTDFDDLVLGLIAIGDMVASFGPTEAAADAARVGDATTTVADLRSVDSERWLR
jgi:hypothetical protein